MYQLLKVFRFNLLKLLNSFNGNKNISKIVPTRVKWDLWIWKKAVRDAANGFPLKEAEHGAPWTAVQFISDAAGAALTWEKGVCQNITVLGDRGVSSLGYRGEDIFFAKTLFWPKNLLFGTKDCNGTAFGCKSTTLETVGLLLPFLSIPNELKGKHIVLEVDNLAVVYSWEKKYSKNDAETSLLIRCLHVLEAYLECRIHVVHCRRLSTEMASLADRLSRQSTTSPKDFGKISHLNNRIDCNPVTDWLGSPLLNWELPNQIVMHIENM